MDEAGRIPKDLPTLWRERAQLLRDWGGDPTSAKAWDLAGSELEQALRNAEVETFNLTEAAKATGYTPEHLGALVRQGVIKNAGRPGAPRIRRGDLPPPKPPNRGRPPGKPVGRDAKEVAASLLQGGRR